jgi:cell division septation protein DedD
MESFLPGSFSFLNDLWKYDPATNNWTWMKGADFPNQYGIYGTQGLAAPDNTPGARSNAVSWTDASGNLWLFSGYGRTRENTFAGYYNDLWKYEPASGHWTWIKGADFTNQPATYGIKGVEAPENAPGARNTAVSWTDLSGNLWLFGGRGMGANANSFGYLNDLWKYNPATGGWTWIKGADTSYQPGICKHYGVADSDNTPGARVLPVSWTDTQGALWLFGGSGYDCGGYQAYLGDLWRLTLDEVTSPTPTSTPSPTETPTPPPTATPTDTPTTPTPTATPTPTLAPTDTPLPTDTPTPQPTPTPVSFGFENSEEGWSFVSAAEFDAPIFRHVPGIDPGDTESTGVIMLVARNNTSTFGYWESPVFDLSGDEIIPAGVIPFEGPTGPDSLYTAHYRVGTSTADPGRVPQLRLRTTASNLQQSTLLMVDSRHDGAFSPTPEGREYILPFTPAPGATRFLLSFDLLNFNPADDPNGDLLLYSVQVARRDVGLLGEPTTHRSYTFNEDAEGWVQCATAAFTPPIFAAEPGALTLRGVAGDTNVFGYWGSPEADILIDPSRLYIVTFEVESDVAPEDRARVPQFRCRVNEKSYHAAMYVVVESRGDAARSPVAGQPQYYTVYFLPPAAAAGEGLILSLDFLNFDAVDIPDATLKLRSATVRSVPNPFAGN